MKFKDFSIPDKEYYPRPLWFWNAPPTKEALEDILDSAQERSSYGGFGILPYDACKLEYMSEEYLDAYGYVLEKAKENGLKICLYDEWWFPSGGAGGLLKKKYPKACAKRLDRHVFDVEGRIDLPLPEGRLMSATAVHKVSREIRDLRGLVNNGNLTWTAPSDDWSVMIFVCVLSDWDHVNYLDPVAVEKFIEITHEAYYKRFPSYFGTVIDSSFYDEPQMYAVEGRMWTDDFNERFKDAYGFDPSPLYPALWEDIGADTTYARSMLLGFRAELYANGFPKVLGEWCAAHGIKLTGHVDQEEVINPTVITGDLMKSFKFQDIPGFDSIMHHCRSSKIYKIVSSAAYNWDKGLVMSECFGAMGNDLSIECMYDEAMEQYAKGMNLFVPHAVWTDDTPEKIIFPPELSYRNPLYRDTLKDFNLFCARMSYLMQGGRHKADIALLYPIDGLQSATYFEWGGSPYEGAPVPKNCNYMDLGEWLFSIERRDFTFLHPEVLDEKCEVRDQKLCLDNEINFEEYKAIVIPSTDTMRLGNVQKIKDFWESGGTVIFAGELPVHSVERGKDQHLKQLVSEMISPVSEGYSRTLSPCGGKAYHISSPTPVLLREVLVDAEIGFAVELSAPESQDVISYIHKEKDGKDILYVVNCSDDTVTCDITLAASLPYELWDPHSGEKKILPFEIKNDGRHLYRITLLPHRSTVLVGDAKEGK